MIIFESSSLFLSNDLSYIDFMNSSKGRTSEYSEHRSHARDTCQAQNMDYYKDKLNENLHRTTVGWAHNQSPQFSTSHNVKISVFATDHILGSDTIKLWFTQTCKEMNLLKSEVFFSQIFSFFEQKNCFWTIMFLKCKFDSFC